MKKIIATTVALLILLTLVSCGAQENKKTSPPTAPEYVFLRDGESIAPGESASAIRRLGQYKSRRAVGSCAGVGEDVLYVYDGFRVTVYGEDGNGGGHIQMIEFTNDTVSTAEGIFVGADVESVVRAYGAEYSEVGEGMRYVGKNCILQFSVRDGTVTSIKYIAL
jgi:hypothetical protein